MKSQAGRWLCLIRHAAPEIDLSVPTREWKLSTEGRTGAGKLAGHLDRAGISPAVIYSSPESKARETAAILGDGMGVHVLVHPELHEHVRPMAPEKEKADFRASVAALFARPGEVIYGSESAEQALSRFGQAVDEICEQENGDVCIVAHGTVISLLAASRCGIDGYELWKKLGLPAMLAVQLPDHHLSLTRCAFRV